VTANSFKDIKFYLISQTLKRAWNGIIYRVIEWRKYRRCSNLYRHIAGGCSSCPRETKADPATAFGRQRLAQKAAPNFAQDDKPLWAITTLVSCYRSILPMLAQKESCIHAE
jgi:hypothetical protein